MKKSTIIALYTYLTEEIDSTLDPVAMDELTAEYQKVTTSAKASAYDAAWEVVKNTLANVTSLTAKQIFEAAKDDLPDGFTANKVQYGLLNYWKDYVVKHDNGKSAKTYSLA